MFSANSPLISWFRTIDIVHCTKIRGENFQVMTIHLEQLGLSWMTHPAHQL